MTSEASGFKTFRWECSSTVGMFTKTVTTSSNPLFKEPHPYLYHIKTLRQVNACCDRSITAWVYFCSGWSVFSTNNRRMFIVCDFVAKYSSSYLGRRLVHWVALILSSKSVIVGWGIEFLSRGRPGKNMAHLYRRTHRQLAVYNDILYMHMVGVHRVFQMLFAWGVLHLEDTLYFTGTNFKTKW